MAVWHGVDYLQREVIDQPNFYKSWDAVRITKINTALRLHIYFTVLYKKLLYILFPHVKLLSTNEWLLDFTKVQFVFIFSCSNNIPKFRTAGLT